MAMRSRAGSSRRYKIDVSEEELIEQEGEDALRATPEERMAAAVALLDTTYQLWISRGFADEQGLCRVPGRTQQSRRVLRRDLGDGGPVAHPLPDHP